MEILGPKYYINFVNQTLHLNLMSNILIAAFYKFVPLPDFESLQEPIRTEASRLGISGTLLLASEGINGTVGGSEQNLREFLAYLRADSRLSDLEHKESVATKIPFKRLKVRLKKEIVPLGVPGIEPQSSMGTYVQPSDWNKFVSNDDVVLIDTRNNYEVAFGTFADSLNPNTRHFRQFAKWAENSKDQLEGKKIAMFCTGGIRCEKASSLLKELGHEEVYQLKGGILKYLEEVPQEESKWNGECFVFDDRISVDHNLNAKWGEYVPPEAHSAVYPAPKMSPEEKLRRKQEANLKPSSNRK